MSLRFTKHGEMRANQRGFRGCDVELIRRCGTLVADREAEVYVLLNKDVEQEISTRKQEIQRLERMRGCKVVIDGDQLITVHHTSRRHEKTLLRRTG